MAYADPTTGVAGSTSPISRCWDGRLMALAMVALTFALIPARGWAASGQTAPGLAGPNSVEVISDDAGSKLRVDGRDLMIIGMNWGYTPVGENYGYSLWLQPDAFIEEALRRDMTMLRGMGVNAIRQYSDVPPKWVTWIYENFGIYTAVNHTAGRYGYDIDGAFIPRIDYSDPHVRETIVADIVASAERFKDVPGVLMWMIGNENNYGLEWNSFEIEALPAGERQAAKAVHLYSFFGEIVDGIHAVDPHHPVSIANGDIQYLELIAQHCPNLDILGANVYRGVSARDLYERVQAVLGVPVYFSEMGADAFDAKAGVEDAEAQAYYLREQWKDLYAQSYGKGKVGNAIGAFTFQRADGWWKYLQESNLDVHDTTASWPNSGYPLDFVEGQGNMNEEWFGIAAIGPSDERGFIPTYPRTAYYLLKEAFRLDPYGADTTLATINAHFDRLDPQDFRTGYDVSRLDKEIRELSRTTVTNVRVNLETITSKTPDAVSGRQGYTFDNMESAFFDFRVKPASNFEATASVNVLGNVAQNKINEIFFEARGRGGDLLDADGNLNVERVKLYQSTFEWRTPYADVEGFYRSGHYHWGYEGDFFGFFPEANYQPAVDQYNANAPAGIIVTAKGALDGLKVAAGPEVVWGANPTALAKYQRQLGPVDMAVLYQEDVAQRVQIQSSVAVPEPVNRRASVALNYGVGAANLTLGGLWSGSPRVGRTFTRVQEAEGDTYLQSGYYVLVDEVLPTDTLGAKGKLTFKKGPVQAYVQGAYKGLVADGGADSTVTFTGWSLKEDGRGNQYNVLGGLALGLGSFQIAPNVLYQKPLVGPNPAISDYYAPASGVYYPSVVPRNVVDDPFVVLGNRETLGLELLLVFDPTPGSWFWQWNNAIREDAGFAASLDFVYRIQPTSRDSNLGFTADGVLFSFDGAPPAQNVWDVTGRVMINPGLVRIMGTLYGGQGQSNGSDARLVTRYGAGARVQWRNMLANTWVKVNDWGPYDYHRDFNLTFPLQVMADLSVGVVPPRFVGSYTRFGVRAEGRTLDQFSARYPYGPGDDRTATEVEIGTFINISL